MTEQKHGTVVPAPVARESGPPAGRALDLALTASSIAGIVAFLGLASTFEGPGLAGLVVLLALALGSLELIALIGSLLVRLDPDDRRARAGRRRRAWLGRFVGASTLVWAPALVSASGALDASWPMLCVAMLLAGSLLVRVGQTERYDWAAPAAVTALFAAALALTTNTLGTVEQGFAGYHAVEITITFANLGAHVLLLYVRRANDDPRHPDGR